MIRRFDDFTGLEGTEENRLYPVSVFVADRLFFKLDLSAKSLAELVGWVQGGRDRVWGQFGREDPDPIVLAEDSQGVPVKCFSEPVKMTRLLGYLEPRDSEAA